MRKIAITILLLFLPLTFVVHPVIRVLGMYESLLAYSFENEPDPSTFQEVNYTKLAEVADWTDQRFVEYHMPLNVSSPTFFVDENYTEVDYYKYGDNRAARTGISYSAWVHKYIAAKRENDQEQEEFALGVLKNLTHGLSMLMKVPNGGLGAQFPGKLARGYAPPGSQDIAQYYYRDNPKHFNGTGKYSQYIWRDFTSNDEHAGYYLFLALALKYLEDPWIIDTVYKIVDQLANYHIQNNFKVIAAHGGPSGAQQTPALGSNAFWKALLLKMASMCYPEKYEDDYYYFISNEMGYLHTNMGGAYETISNYFAYNFGHSVCFSYLLLEGVNTEVGKTFYEGFLNSLRHNVENHRNPYFNAMFLALQAELLNITRGDFPILEHDVEDQMMNLIKTHHPDRAREAPPIPDSYEPVPAYAEITEFVKNHPHGDFYATAMMEVELDQTMYTRPLTADLMAGKPFIWSRSPYLEPEEVGKPLLENSGITFLTPYWIMRAHGFMLATGTKPAYEDYGGNL